MRIARLATRMSRRVQLCSPTTRTVNPWVRSNPRTASVGEVR